MDSPWVKIIVLGVVQGITEFLPISSSGHLAILQRVLGDDSVAESHLLVTVVLHTGSLGAIITYYRRDLVAILQQRNWRLVGRLALGTAPLVVLGYPLKAFLETFGTNLWVVAGGFLISFLLLTRVHRKVEIGQLPEQKHWSTALWIGLIQCLAVIPGISRSGSTISLASRLGYGCDAAARFSFMLGIPAILGATVLELKDLLAGGRPPVDYGLLAAGFAVSFAVSFGCLALLVRVLRRGRLTLFGYYCLGAGAACMILQLSLGGS